MAPTGPRVRCACPELARTNSAELTPSVPTTDGRARGGMVRVVAGVAGGLLLMLGGHDADAGSARERDQPRGRCARGCARRARGRAVLLRCRPAFHAATHTARAGGYGLAARLPCPRGERPARGVRPLYTFRTAGWCAWCAPPVRPPRPLGRSFTHPSTRPSVTGAHSASACLCVCLVVCSSARSFVHTPVRCVCLTVVLPCFRAPVLRERWLAGRLAGLLACRSLARPPSQSPTRSPTHSPARSLNRS